MLNFISDMINSLNRGLTLNKEYIFYNDYQIKDMILGYYDSIGKVPFAIYDNDFR